MLSRTDDYPIIDNKPIFEKKYHDKKMIDIAAWRLCRKLLPFGHQKKWGEKLNFPYSGISMTYTPSMSAKHALEVIQGKRSHILILLHFL